MPEYLAPGVYIEEVEIGSKPIEGVSTSTAGFLGEAERGPTSPRLVTGWLQYQRMYGSFFGPDQYLPYAVKGFFDNGGQRCFISRIVKADAQAASIELPKNNNDGLQVEAVGEGSWGNRVAVKVAPGSINGFKISLFYWRKKPDSLVDPELQPKAVARPDQIESFDNLALAESSLDYYQKRINGISNLITISALGDESDAFPHQEGTVQEGTASTIKLAAAASTSVGAYSGMRVEIISGKGKGQLRLITDYDPETKVAELENEWDEGQTPDDTSKYLIHWLQYLSGGKESKAFAGQAAGGTETGITLDENAAAAAETYIGKNITIVNGAGVGQVREIIAYDSEARIARIDAWDTGKAPDSSSEYLITPLRLVLADYERTDTDAPGQRRGLTAFTEIDDISLVYAPAALSVDGLVNAVVTHCENLRDRFAIIDCARNSADVSQLNPRDDYETKYAAFYCPWIRVLDPEVPGLVRMVPPGGSIAGIYARTDTERGVHKAPANEVVRGAVSLEYRINKAEQDILNPRAVNVIRVFADSGIRVWGARTLSSDPAWRYINISRLFLYLEESIDAGTQWVVFEPNNERLWARVKSTITEFLTRVWRDGALMGTKAEEAFFVKVDRTTMTQSDIDNGRLIVLIGVAPVIPAEFVVFRIAQWTGGSSAE